MASTLAGFEYNKDPTFRNDELLKKVNQFVTLKTDHKKSNTFHLEQVLKEGLIPLMRKQDSLFDNLYNSIMYGGSFYKGTKVGKPDEYDLNIILLLPWRQEFLKFETPEKKPGFMKIKITEECKKPDWHTYSKQLNSLISWNNYMDQEKLRQWIESIIDKCLNNLQKDSSSFDKDVRILEVKNVRYGISKKKSGPAFTFMIKLSNGQVIDVDFVPCFGLSVPPPKRYKGFENRESWSAIPKPCSEENGNLMWRLSFYQEEKKLLKGPMKTVIRLLKKLRDTQNLSNFVSYFFETVGLHELKNNEKNPDFLKLPLTCLFMHMLERLRDAAKENLIPFYWCKEMNLLYKISPIEMQNYAGRLSHIVSEIKKSIQSNKYIIASFILKPEELSQIQLTGSKSVEDKTEKTSRANNSTRFKRRAGSLIRSLNSSCTVNSKTEEKPVEKPPIEKPSVEEPSSSQSRFTYETINQDFLNASWGVPKFLWVYTQNYFEAQDRKRTHIVELISELKEELKEIKSSVENLSNRVSKLETKNKLHS